MKEVFILEDDGSMREMLTCFIKKSGYEVRAFASPKEALQELIHKTPDILISDINMPGMNGFEMAEWLRQEGISLPVIFMSADISQEVEARAASLSVKHLFKKPLRDLSRLISAMEDEISRSSPLEPAAGLDDLRASFLEEMSHELRTPLTSIKLALEGLRIESETGNSTTRAKLISISQRNVNKLIELIENKLGLLKTRLLR